MLLQKVIKETKQHKYLLLKKLKIQHHGHMRSKNGKEILKTFHEQEVKKTISIRS